MRTVCHTLWGKQILGFVAVFGFLTHARFLRLLVATACFAWEGWWLTLVSSISIHHAESAIFKMKVFTLAIVGWYGVVAAAAVIDSSGCHGVAYTNGADTRTK